MDTTMTEIENTQDTMKADSVQSSIEHILKTFNLTENHSGTAIGNQWLDANGDRLTSNTPITDGKIQTIQTTNMDQLDQVINASHKAFLKWREVPAPKRGEIIRLIGDRLRHYKDTLGSLVALEMGKSKQEGDGEVQEMIDMADFAVGQARMLYGKTMHSERPEHRMYEQWHPYGVVGVISAFNFPVAVWSWNAFVAAICGNTVIWRPSPKTPLCAIAVHKICQEVIAEHHFPNIFSLVTSDDIDFSKAFVNDTRLPMISFTGSTPVGREVAKQVAERFGKSLLELGGNNAAIIDQSADLKRTIPAVVFGAVGTCGQRCTTLRRLLVHESIYEKVVDKLASAYSKLKIGSPLDTHNHVGPLIDQDSVNRYLKAIEEVKAAGGKIRFGGNQLNRDGFFVEPAIVEAQPSWAIVNEETFAPILYVMPFKSIDDAIEMNNQVNYGLSSAIFTQDVRTAEYFLSAKGSDCGIANVNIGTSGAEIGGAFGGEKHTGGGREAGSDAWKAYMRRQTNTINWGLEMPLAQGIEFNL
ncbi:aldehyde dehydrogenase family protein [Thiotrichales bacterium 19S9-12]|nr:aldehyde dehydrogenase family protein [Thiotrichales bacterium 19S9-11]MCF6812012.1 aldehyde dehydrogenase family protein [Thiotrichales bacterium 19S9-12]